MSRPNVAIRVSATPQGAETASNAIPLSKPTLVSASEAEAKMASGEWLLVRANDGSNSEEKRSAAGAREGASVVSTARPNGARGRVGKVREMRTTLAVAYSVSSSANTAYTTVLGLTPTGSSEWSSFSGIWDEFKVEGVHQKYAVSATGVAGALAPALAVFAYDPGNTTALGSVADGCVFRQHALTLATGASAGNSPAGLGANPSGLFDFRIKPPGGTLLDSATATNVVGSWSLTSSTDTCGYLKPYIQALGSGVSAVVAGILYFDVRFRTRQ